MFNRAYEELGRLCNSSSNSQSTVSITVRRDGRNFSALSIIPEWSSSEAGLVMRIRDDVIAEHFNVQKGRVGEVCGDPVEIIPGVDSSRLWGSERLFDEEKLDHLIDLLKGATDKES